MITLSKTTKAAFAVLSRANTLKVTEKRVSFTTAPEEWDGLCETKSIPVEAVERINRDYPNSVEGQVGELRNI